MSEPTTLPRDGGGEPEDFQLPSFGGNHVLPFFKKIRDADFDLYSIATDPIQHFRHYQDKMVVYLDDDLLMSRVFPSSPRESPSTGSTLFRATHFETLRR